MLGEENVSGEEIRKRERESVRRKREKKEIKNRERERPSHKKLNEKNVASNKKVRKDGTRSVYTHHYV